MKLLVLSVTCFLAVEALPHHNFLGGGAGLPIGGLPGQPGLGGLGTIPGGLGTYGAGSSLGQSGFTGGQSGFGSQGFGQRGLNQGHNIGHVEDDFNQVVSSHHSAGHNVGGVGSFETGGGRQGGFNNFDAGSNLFQNAYTQGQGLGGGLPGLG